MVNHQLPAVTALYLAASAALPATTQAFGVAIPTAKAPHLQRYPTECSAVPFWNKDNADASGVVDGYRDRIQAAEKEGNNAVIGKSLLPKKKNLDEGTPGGRLMKDYEFQSTFTAEPIPLDEPTARPFDAFKGAVWNGVDAVQSIAGKKNNNNINSPASPVAQLPAPREVREALPDLTSANPVTRFRAQQRIKKWEESERKQRAAQQQAEQRDKIKETVYQTADAVQWTTTAVASLPEKIAQGAAGTTEAIIGIPKAVASAADAVAAVPEQVEQTKLQVQKQIDSTVQTTNQVVEKVKQLPETLDQTRESLDRAAQAVGELATTSKVALGLEKPVPKPPTIPPPPKKSTEERAQELAEAAATNAGKIAWWAGKTTVTLAWKGVSAGIGQGIKTFQDPEFQNAARAQLFPQKQNDNDKPQAMTRSSGVQSPPPATPQQTTTLYAEQPKSPPTPPKAQQQQPRQPPLAPPPMMQRQRQATTEIPEPAPVPEISPSLKAELDVDVASALQLAREALENPGTPKQQQPPAPKVLQEPPVANDQLDQEVAEALKMAEQAMGAVNTTDGKKQKKKD